MRAAESLAPAVSSKSAAAATVVRCGRVAIGQRTIDGSASVLTVLVAWPSKYAAQNRDADVDRRRPCRDVVSSTLLHSAREV